MESSAFARRLTPCAEFPNDNPDLHHGAIWRCLEVRGEPVWERPVLVPSSLGEVVDTVLGASDHGEVVDELVDASVPVDAPALFQDSPPVIALPRWFEAVLEDSPASPRSAHESAVIDGRDAAEEEENEAGDGLGFASDSNLDDDLDDELEPIEIVDELSFDAAFEGVIDEQQTGPEAASEPSGDRQDIEAPFDRLIGEVEIVARVHGADDACVAVLRALFGSTRLDGVQPMARAVEALVAGGIVVQGPRGMARSTTFTEQVVAWRGILGGESEEFPTCGALDEWTANVVARALGNTVHADVIRRELRRHGIAAFGLVAA